MIERIQTTFDCCDDCAHGQCIMARGFLAEVAALHDEVERLRPFLQNMCADGHQPIRWVSKQDWETCPVCALRMSNEDFQLAYQGQWQRAEAAARQKEKK